MNSSVESYSNLSNENSVSNDDVCFSIDNDNEERYEREHANSFVNEKKRIYESANNRCAKKNKRNNISNNEPSYIQVFRCEKPAHVVARRNARERKRVQAVNSAFSRLQKAVPTENQSKRLSKVKTLQKAIEYISDLMDLLDKANEIETNSTIDSPSSTDTRSSSCSTQEATTFIAFPTKENSTCHQSQETTANELNAIIEQYQNEEYANIFDSRDYFCNYFMNAIN